MKHSRVHRPIHLVTTMLVMAGLFAAAGQADVGADLPEGKRTTLGLYATAVQAYEAWAANPDDVTILDVRTPEEFMFVGHPDMAWNVPIFMQTLDWDEQRGRFSMTPVPEFVDNVKKIASLDDTIYLICRSGGRSAMAVDKLAEAGFTNVFTVTDGVEGDKVKDETHPDFGHRTINGWKNSELPWTYAIDRQRMVLPAE